VLDDAPNTVVATAARATYTASAWVRVPTGRVVTLRVRELRGRSVVRTRVATITGTGGWRQLVVTSAATGGGNSLSVELLVSLAKGASAQVDDVSLKRG
jgi:hypothetical protein